MDNIKAVFFDLDDTLHDFKQASGEAMSIVYDKIAGRYGADKSRLKERYGELLKMAEERAFLDGRSSAEYRFERFEQLLFTFGIEDEKFATELVRLYGAELEKRLALFPNTIAILERLGQKYELYLVTEGPSDAQQRALEILGIKKHFKGVFISGELGKIKSTGDLFRHAVEKSGHGADEIVLVGDSYKRDMLGGLKAGLKVIWLNRKNEKLGDGAPFPACEIGSLSELESKLAKKPSSPILILGHPRSGTNFVSAI